MNAAPTPTPESKAAETTYVILRQGEGESTWHMVNRTALSGSSQAAIRSVVAKLAAADQAGTFVAVPSRSWKPVKVSTKTETTVVIA